MLLVLSKKCTKSKVQSKVQITLSRKAVGPTLKIVIIFTPKI